MAARTDEVRRPAGSLGRAGAREKPREPVLPLTVTTGLPRPIVVPGVRPLSSTHHLWRNWCSSGTKGVSPGETPGKKRR